MSVIEAYIKADGRNLKPTFTGIWINHRAQIKLSGTITYLAYCDRADEPTLSLLYSPKLPQLGSRYAEDGAYFRGLYYSDATPRFIGAVGSRWCWEIAYTIGGDFSTGSTSTTEETGTSEEKILTNFSLGVETEDYASACDLDGLWNCNSIGEFFSDPIIFKSAIVTFNYSRKEYYNPLSMINEYFQAHNSTAWYGLDAGRVKVAEITFSAAVGEYSTTYDVNYKLQYRRGGWGVEKANSGYYCKVGGTVVRATNSDGSPVDSPILLATDGTRLTAGATVPMRTFRTTYPKDLNLLGLPNPFTL